MRIAEFPPVFHLTSYKAVRERSVSSTVSFSKHIAGLNTSLLFPNIVHVTLKIVKYVSVGFRPTFWISLSATVSE